MKHWYVLINKYIHVFVLSSFVRRTVLPGANGLLIIGIDSAILAYVSTEGTDEDEEFCEEEIAKSGLEDEEFAKYN